MEASFCTINKSTSELVKLDISAAPDDFETNHYSGLGRLNPGKSTIRIGQYVNLGEKEIYLVFCSDETGGESLQLQDNGGYAFMYKADDKLSELQDTVSDVNSSQYFFPLIKYTDRITDSKEKKSQKNYFNYGFTPDAARFLFKDSQNVYEVMLIVEPAMGIDLYNRMIDELLSVRFSLAYQKNSSEKTTYLFNYQVQLEDIHGEVQALSEILEALSQDPMSDIESVPARLPFRSVKHMDVHVIMDHYVLHKPKVRTHIHQKTFDTYENRKIAAYIWILSKRLHSLERVIDAEKYGGLSTKVGYSQSNLQLKKQIHKIQTQLERLADSDMFRGMQNSKEALYPLHSTNLFVNHPKYKQTFRLMKRYEDVSKVLDGKTSYLSYNKSNELYEVWCFFKILDLLINVYGYKVIKVNTKPEDADAPYVSPENTNPHETLSRYIDQFLGALNKPATTHTLHDFVIYLEQTDNPAHNIYLGYNCTMSAQCAVKGYGSKTEDIVRPDILMIVNKKYIYTCDAKYKNYKEDFMGIKEWYVDLFECAAHKYQYRMKEEQMRFGKDIRFEKKGCCILTPAITDPAYQQEVYLYNGEKLQEKYAQYLDFLKAGLVNTNYKGKRILDEEEYTGDFAEKVKSFENQIASARFLPGDVQNFRILFGNIFRQLSNDLFQF